MVASSCDLQRRVGRCQRRLAQAGPTASGRQATRADICLANGGHDGCRLRAGVLVGFTRPDAARSSRCGRTHGQGLGATGIRVGGSLRTAAAAVRPHHHQQRPRLVVRVQVDRSRCSGKRRWLASLSERDDVPLSDCRKSGGGGNRTRVLRSLRRIRRRTRT
jgi:hypothetical protein